MKKHASQCNQEYLGPAYAGSNFSPSEKLKLVEMTISVLHICLKTLDLHQYPVATLYNCSRNRAVFPRADLNPKGLCVITSPAACFPQQYHAQTIPPHIPLFSAILSSANLSGSVVQPCQLFILSSKSPGIHGFTS